MSTDAMLQDVLLNLGKVQGKLDAIGVAQQGQSEALRDMGMRVGKLEGAVKVHTKIGSAAVATVVSIGVGIAKEILGGH